jgi:hypothetical protein
MKLDRIASTNQRHSAESTERTAHVVSERISPVEAPGGVESDRGRSLQQELAEILPGAIGDFHGEEQVMQGARDVASQLIAMGSAADGLIKPGGLKMGIRGIDDSA